MSAPINLASSSLSINVLKGISLNKGVINYAGNAPANYELSNYPNPFNPTTKIRVGIPEAAEVSLTIYNSIGQEVTRLANKTMLDAGVYDYEWNASNMPSGIYLYRLTANENIRIKKMILMK